MSTRGAGIGARRVVIMQRLHEQDLSGHILEREASKWTHICLPLRYEEGRMKTTVIGGYDLRRDLTGEAADVLSPSYISAAKADELAEKLGSYGTAGQLQQRPAPKGGGFYKMEWFKIVPASDLPGPDDFDELCRYWDKAGTDKTSTNDPSFTVGLLMGRRGGRYYVLDVVRFRASAEQRDKRIELVAAMDQHTYGAKVMVRFEQEPGSGGKQSAEESVRDMEGYRASIEPAQLDKVLRSESTQKAAERGDISIAEADWNRDFLDEITVFPASRYKDQADGFSGAYRYLSQARKGLLSAARLLTACTLPDGKEAARLSDTMVGAIYCDARDETLAFCIFGLTAGNKLVLVQNQCWPLSRQSAGIAAIQDAARNMPLSGVAFVPSQAQHIAFELATAGVAMYESSLDSGARSRIARSLATAFQSNLVAMYRDDDLLREMVKLPVEQKAEGYTLREPDPSLIGISRGMAFTMALHWAYGTMLH